MADETEVGVGQETGGAPDWTSALDADLRGVVTAKGWKGPGDVVKGYANLEKLVGFEKIPVPGKDAAPDVWDAVYARLGRPDAADKYDLGDFKPPADVPWDEAGQKAMLGAMHKAGLSSRQARAILDAYAAHSAEGMNAINAKIGEAQRAAQDQLQREWGAAHGAKLDVANRAFKMAFGDATEAARQIKLADGTFLFDNPALVRAFAAIGEKMGEETLKGQGGGRLTMTPQEAQAELARMHGDPEIIAKMLDKMHPENAALQAKREALSRAAYPA